VNIATYFITSSAVGKINQCGITTLKLTDNRCARTWLVKISAQDINFLQS